jgi:hypothetical protein
MKRTLFFGLTAVALVAIQGISPERHVPGSAGKNDTCYYFIHVPPDIDVPSTPHFDTLIARNADCNVHVLCLPGWGTVTTYTLRENIMGRKDPDILGRTTFGADSKGYIDITKLPAGRYSMGLSACGNGGSFGIEIR